jgi:hypothetical protein
MIITTCQHGHSIARSLNILTHPSESFGIALPADNRAHEYLNRADALVRIVTLALASCEIVKAENASQLLLRCSCCNVHLVAKDDEWHLHPVRSMSKSRPQDTIFLMRELGCAFVVIQKKTNGLIPLKPNCN